MASQDVYNDYLDYKRKPLIRGLNKRVSSLTLKLAKLFFIFGVTLFVIAYVPSIWYATSPDKIANITNLLAQTATKSTDLVIEERMAGDSTTEAPKSDYQPKVNKSLPVESTMIIPSVGIETVINEATKANYEEALRLGVWRVTDFGTPYERELPTILAAHRYGYLKWSIPYRLKNSFYNLPKLKVGDTVEIDWRQRKYIYEVYKESNGEDIEDYSADLILYTCESLNSPIRIIKYGKLLEI